MNDANNSSLRLWDFLWKQRIRLVVGAALGFLLGVVVSFLFAPKYEVEAVVVPTAEPAGGVSTALANLGGLASMVGIGPTSLDTEKSKALALLVSDAFLAGFLESHSINGTHGPTSGVFRRIFPGEGQRTKAELVRWFRQEVLTVVDDRRAGVVKILVRWNDPVVAAAWANSMVADVNETLRREAMKESAESISYLNQQLASTTIIELREAVGSLIEAQLQRQMVAAVRDEYALKTVAPAVALHGLRPVSPNRLAMGVAAALLAIALLICIALSKDLE